MPFCASHVQPDCLARRPEIDAPEDFQFDDFNHVTAFTIVQAIRQLSSLTREASEVFDNTLKSIQDFVRRTSLLEPRIRDIEHEVSKLNRKRNKVGRSALKKQNVPNADWRFHVDLTENLFTPELRPLSVERYRSFHTDSVALHLARYQNYIKTQLSNSGSSESVNSRVSFESTPGTPGTKFKKNPKRTVSLNRWSIRRKNQSQDSFKGEHGDKSPSSLSKFKNFPRPNSCDVLNSDDAASTASDPNDESFASLHSRESSNQLVEYELRAQQLLHPSADNALGQFRYSSMLAMSSRHDPDSKQPTSSCSDLVSSTSSNSTSEQPGPAEHPPPLGGGGRGLYANQRVVSGVKDRPLSLFEGKQLQDGVNKMQTSLQHSEFDQSSDQVDSVLDNLPVLSEENEEEADSNDITSDTYVITSDNYETLRNKGLINTSSGDNASVIYGGSDNSEQSPRNLIGTNSENNLSNQSEDESKTKETITDGSRSGLRKSLDLLPSRWDPKRRMSSKDDLPSANSKTAEAPTTQRNQSFVARSRKWATKRLMSSGSSAGSGRSGSAVGVKRDEGEKKEGKEESKCNGNVLPNGTAEAPILMSLDLETPSKVKPDLIAAQLDAKMDYNNSSTANGKNERRRASFQCFDDSRFMSLPRVNHFKFYDYANLDADALREAMAKSEMKGVVDGQSRSQASTNGWPDAFYMNTGGGPNTSRKNSNQEAVTPTNSIFNSDVVTQADDDQSVSVTTSISGSENHIRQLPLDSKREDRTDGSADQPHSRPTSLGAESLTSTISNKEDTPPNQDLDTLSNNSTLVDEDEDQNILPLDEAAPVLTPVSSTHNQDQFNLNTEDSLPSVQDGSSTVSQTDLPCTQSSIIEPQHQASIPTSSQFLPSSSQTESSSSSSIPKSIPTPYQEPELNSDPIMSSRSHPPLLFSQMSDPTYNLGYPNYSNSNQIYAQQNFGYSIQGYQPPNAPFVNQDPQLIIDRSFLPAQGFPNQMVIMSQNRNQFSDPTRFQNRPDFLQRKPQPLQLMPTVNSQPPVSSFMNPTSSKSKKSKKTTWTDILWKPKGSSSDKSSTGTFTGSGSSQGKQRFPNLNPSADKVTSRSRSATDRLSFFRKKPKAEKQSAQPQPVKAPSPQPLVIPQNEEALRTSNNLEYLEPIPSDFATSGLERVTNLPQDNYPVTSAAGSSYINLEGAQNSMQRGKTQKTDQSFDSIESNYNTGSISSSVYAENSTESTGSVEKRDIQPQFNNYFNAEASIPGTEYYNGIPPAMKTSMPLDEIKAATGAKDGKSLRDNNNYENDDHENETANGENEHAGKGDEFITTLSAEEFVQSQLNDGNEQKSVRSDPAIQNELPIEGAAGSVAQELATNSKDNSFNSGSDTPSSKSDVSSNAQLRKRNKIVFNENVCKHSVESIYDDYLHYENDSQQTEKEKEREIKIRTAITQSLAKQPTRSILRRSASSRNPDFYAQIPFRHSGSFEYGYPGPVRSSYTGSEESTDSNSSNPSIPFIDDEKGSQLSIYEDTSELPSSFLANNIDPRWLAMQSSLGQPTRAVLDDDADLDLIDDDEFSDEEDESGSDTEEEAEDNDSVVYHAAKIVSC
ncbi:uncharacterized protein LOC142340587 isoform X2 [Convolutriloba macropyga]|uniref:uncharacterized protein LOC142340587 isoform X2 n=1 Tax=Convolutriloba macropyga TaxID=536237 RepID=UPI003F527D1F